ncbi:MAG: 50S ribosomal protein L29 [Desulfosudaceae bacterium]
MKPEEIKALSAEEMQQKFMELKEAYFNLRFQHETGQLDNTSALKKTRRDIARVKTEMNRQNV